MRLYFAASSFIVLTFLGTAHAQAPLKTHNIVLVMTDGLRWQEVFRGADDALITKEKGYVSNVNLTRERYWRDTPEGPGEVGGLGGEFQNVHVWQL